MLFFIEVEQTFLKFVWNKDSEEQSNYKDKRQSRRHHTPRFQTRVEARITLKPKSDKDTSRKGEQVGEMVGSFTGTVGPRPMGIQEMCPRCQRDLGGSYRGRAEL